MRQTFIITSAQLEKLRQAARKLKRGAGIPHHEALEKVALEMGLPNWHQAVESAQVTSVTEKAYFAGLVLGMDIKDAQDFKLNELFVRDEQFYAICFEDIKEMYEEWRSEESGKSLREILSDEELISGAQDELMNFEFFRFVGSTLPETIDDVLKLVRTHSFWPPHYVWLRGELIDTYAAPALDEDGRSIGVRL